MDRFNWMAAKAYLPTLFGLIGSFVVVSLGAKFIGHEYISQIGRLVVLAGAGLALVSICHGIWMTFQLWRWECGEGLACDRCGGLLGRERRGRASRGGEYRKCLACGDNINHRHYR